MLGVLKWIALAIVAIIALVFGLPWAPVLIDNVGSGPYRAHLEANHVILDLEAEEGGFAFPDPFYEASLVMFGEVHGMADPHTLDVALIKHLHRKMGVRWLMAELDYAQALNINAYLETGNEAFLTPIFEGWSSWTAQWASREHYDKWRALHAFNASLPPEDKIRVFGVDKLQNTALALEKIKSWSDATRWRLGENEAPYWAAALARLNPETPDLGFVDDAKLALEALEAEPASMEAVRLSHLLRNVIAAEEGAARYTMILQNVRAMVEIFGVGDDEPVYGFWGYFHSLKAPVNDGAVPLAMRFAQEDLPLTKDIRTIGVMYVRAESMYPTNALPGPLQGEDAYTTIPFSQDFPYIYYQRGVEDFKAVAGDAPATLFRLEGEESPYSGSPRTRTAMGLMAWLQRLDIQTEPGVAHDYLILSQDSAALTPWGEDEAIAQTAR